VAVTQAAVQYGLSGRYPLRAPQPGSPGPQSTGGGMTRRHHTGLRHMTQRYSSLAPMTAQRSTSRFE
jgi:hypothetical protein